MNSKEFNYNSIFYWLLAYKRKGVRAEEFCVLNKNLKLFILQRQYMPQRFLILLFLVACSSFQEVDIALQKQY